MPRHGQFISGPAGVGKSTYCKYIRSTRRLCGGPCTSSTSTLLEVFTYKVDVDIRELISVEDVMEELNLGPNGGLLYCMEYLANNLAWLEEQLDEFGEDAYFLFDCPGQIELFSHVPIMKLVLRHIINNCSVRICGVYLIDALFIDDASKFLSGTMCALSSMTSLELPHINVYKCDLIDTKRRRRRSKSTCFRRKLDPFDAKQIDVRRYQSLNEAIASLIEEYSMVSFVSLNVNDEETVEKVFQHCDHCIQYGEDLEPQEPKDMFDENDRGD